MKKVICRFGILFLSVSLFSGLAFGQKSSDLDRASLKHVLKLKEIQEMGVMLYVHRLRPKTLVERSGAVDDLRAAEIQEIKKLVQLTLDEGMTPIGAVPTWVFPRVARAAKLPLENEFFMGTRLKPPECVPSIGGAEYDRLAGLHSRMLSGLVRELPEIKTWLVGGDSRPLFYDCVGQPLGLEDHLKLILDSATYQYAAIKSANPKASVILHFLGEQGTLLETRDGEIQPRQLQQLLIAELSLRGEAPYDLLASDIDPTLLADREPEPAIPVPFGNQQMLSTSGWNVQELEEFTEETDDLIADYDAWKKIRTNEEDDVLLTDISVDDCVGTPDYCEAILRLEDPSPPLWTSAADASSDPDDQNTDFMPIENFNTGYLLRNKWTAVTDFFPTVEPTVKGPHAASMLRVNDRVWPGPTATQDDQTRFGSIAFGEISRDSAQCTNGTGSTEKFLAALQLTSDSSDGAPELDCESVEEHEGETLLYCFEFDLDSEDFWDNPNTLFRVQIIEEDWFSILTGWTLRWKAEFWDLTPPSGTRLGYYGWVTENTIEDSDQEIPELCENSSITFGIAPGTQGGIDVERTGTAYWVY